MVYAAANGCFGYRKCIRFAETGESKEQTTVSKVANWPEWFQMCGRLGPDLEAYEELVRQYYMLQCSHTEKGKQCARKLYLAHQDTAFYKKKPVVPRWLRKKVMGFAALGFLLVSLLGLLILLIPIFVSNGSLPPVRQMVACSVPFGTLAALLIYQIPSRLHKRKVQKLWKQMSALEETLKPWIVLIPPKYRNSESVQVFFDIFTSYDIYAFSEAVQTCDNHLVQNNMDGLYLAVMFDEPYEKYAVGTWKRNGISSGRRSGFAGGYCVEDVFRCAACG